MQSINGNLSAMRRNLILAALPEKELKTIFPHLEEVALPFGKVMSDRPIDVQ